MDKIELKNLLFLARINAKEEEYPELIKKLQNTFVLIDEMQDLDLSDLDPLNNPLELSNVSRIDKDKNRNDKKKVLVSPTTHPGYDSPPRFEQIVHQNLPSS